MSNHIFCQLSCSVLTEGAGQFPLSALVFCTEAGRVFPITLTLAAVLPWCLSRRVYGGNKKHRKDTDLLERVQSRATKTMMRGLEQVAVAQVSKGRSPACYQRVCDKWGKERPQSCCSLNRRVASNPKSA